MKLKTSAGHGLKAFAGRTLAMLAAALVLCGASTRAYAAAESESTGTAAAAHSTHDAPAATASEHGAAAPDPHAKGSAAEKVEHAAGAHGAEAAGGHGGGGAHLPNIISLLLKLEVSDGKPLAETTLGHKIEKWEPQIFLVIDLAIGLWLLSFAAKRRALMPGRAQMFFEMIHEGTYKFLGGILGDRNLKYVPFLGSLFLFIYIQNVAGVFPLLSGATGAYATTAALAIMVFFYVHIQGIREAGFKHWMLHFLGSPKDTFGWVVGIMLLPLEIVGTLAKPLSLSLRLFGNMMGEHILVGVFLVIGMSLISGFWPSTPIGVPLHLPFLFLGALTTFIQALVFTLLSTIYLLLLLPHDDHHDDHHVHHDDREGMLHDRDAEQHMSVGEISPF